MGEYGKQHTSELERMNCLAEEKLCQIENDGCQYSEETSGDRDPCPAQNQANIENIKCHVSSKKPASVAKRNARERRRIKNVNKAFDELRQHVPLGNQSKKISKVDTLQSAIEYIKALELLVTQKRVTKTKTDKENLNPDGKFTSHANVQIYTPTNVDSSQTNATTHFYQDQQMCDAVASSEKPDQDQHIHEMIRNGNILEDQAWTTCAEYSDLMSVTARIDADIATTTLDGTVICQNISGRTQSSNYGYQYDLAGDKSQRRHGEDDALEFPAVEQIDALSIRLHEEYEQGFTFAAQF